MGLILAFVAGGLIVLLALMVWFYRGCVQEAEKKRDEAVAMAARALEAKQTAEDGFSKAKTFFDERNKLPVIATFTDEQLQSLKQFLAQEVFLSTTRTDRVQ